MPKTSLKTLNRRRVLQALLGGGVAVGVGEAYLWRNARQVRASRATKSVRPVDLMTGTLFLGVLFARRLSTTDIEELSERMRYGCERDPEFRTELLALTRTLDRMAQSRGRVGFRRAAAGERVAIVAELLDHDPGSLVSRAQLQISADQWDRSAARRLAAPRLARLYRKSGAPYRARGYQRWPGMPGHWSEYLTAMVVPA